MMCRWLSIRPGITRRPPASITVVPAPRRGMTSASVPTFRKRPSAIASAAASGAPGSRVVILALWRISAAS